MADAEQLQLDTPAAPTPPVTLNTPHARDMLRKRYPAPEWALLEEVAPSTGGGTRYADAIAVNLWQSRGHAVHGFEIKVSRSDWLRELKQPEKAEPVYRYCDYWWIVAPKGIVKDGELPPTWGLLELRTSGLVQTINAPRLDAQPITRAFFASLMRRGHEQLDRLAELKQRDSIAKARADIDARVAEQVKWSTRRHEELLANMKKFEEQTGLSIGSYGGPPVNVIKTAQQLAKLGDWKGDDPLKKLAKLAEDLEQASAVVRQAMAASGLVPPPADGATE
jgi:hypothetical protein